MWNFYTFLPFSFTPKIRRKKKTNISLLPWALSRLSLPLSLNLIKFSPFHHENCSNRFLIEIQSRNKLQELFSLPLISHSSTSPPFGTLGKLLLQVRDMEYKRWCSWWWCFWMIGSSFEVETQSWKEGEVSRLRKELNVEIEV
jgi:hypothetical protein